MENVNERENDVKMISFKWNFEGKRKIETEIYQKKNVSRFQRGFPGSNPHRYRRRWWRRFRSTKADY